MALMTHMVVPKAFPVIVIWIYLLTTVAQCVGFVIRKPMLLLVL